MSDEQPKRSIDERLDALTVMSAELLLQVQQTSRRIEQLTQIVEKHEHDWQRFRRVMRTALAEWLKDNGEEGSRQ